ncbi:MAG: helix-turn-helix domain-containing protein [Clostridiales bacterium]|nr:helix-turn-helix domain-containing protein [Clostridiales bacterium]
MLTANKCKLYPTEEQISIMSKTLGCSRYVYNLFLDVWNTTYKFAGKGMWNVLIRNRVVNLHYTAGKWYTVRGKDSA